MKKTIYLFLIIAIVATFFVGCSPNSNMSVDATEPNAETQIVTAETEPETESETETIIPASVDWKNCTIVLAGKKITLPCEYSEIVEAGWKIPDKNISTYFPNNNIWFTLAEKDGTHDIGLFLVNTTGEQLTYDKCVVAGISVAKVVDDGFDYSDVLLPGNVSVGTNYSNRDSAYSLYGTPDIIINNCAYWGKTEKMIFDDLSGDGINDKCSKGYVKLVYSSSFDGLTVKEMRLDLSRELIKIDENNRG